MQRRILTVILFLTMTFFSFSENALMAGQKNIRFVVTRYFTIIYGESSETSAAELAAKADAIMDDICGDLAVSANINSFHMPIVITSSTDVFNAYYTNYSYNHIVLYDAVPQENMAVNDETIVDTFKHELTHLVTINMRNGFWKGFDTVFGDVANWGDYVVMPSLIKEGAAVAYESKDGTGRNNDAYYLQTVRQAKIENKFPSWADVTGATDIYPAGNSAYAFGGPFTEWLVKKYGMEKYADFWYRAVNMKAVTYTFAFKKAYGVSLDSAWKDFKNDIVVPQIEPNALAVDGIDDFFLFPKQSEQAAGSDKLSIQNNSGSRYTSVTESDCGIAYLDDSDDSVWLARKNSDGTFAAPKVLFRKKNVLHINFSTDGNFLAVCGYDINHLNVKNAVWIYGMQNGGFYKLNATGLRDASVVCCNGKWFVAAVKTASQNVSLCVYELVTSGNKKQKVVDATLVRDIPFPRGDVAYSLCDGGDGSVACVYKSGLVWSFRLFDGICDAQKEIRVREFTLPKSDMRVRNISPVSADGESKTFAFSWTTPETLPRLGYLVFDAQPYFALASEDISGGVYFPVAYRCADSNRGQLPSVAYVASFFRDNKMFVMNSAKFLFEEFDAQKNDVVQNDGKQERSVDLSVLADSKEYSIPFYTRGFFVPWSTVPQYNKTFSQTGSICFPGITWTTSNPWDSDVVQLSAGYDWLSDTAGVMVAAQSSSSTSLLSYKVRPDILFDRIGVKQAVNYAAVQSGFMIGNVTSLSVSELNMIFLGRQNTADDSSTGINILDEIKDFLKLRGVAASNDTTHYFSALNQVAFKISNIHKYGAGTYEKAGASFSAAYQIAYLGFLGNGFSKDSIYQNIYPEFSFRLPRLVPVTCRSGLTYNLPLSCTVAFFPNYLEFLETQSEVILFSSEIQKGLTFFPLFINRFTVTAEYNMFLMQFNNDFEFIHFFEDVQNMDKMSYFDAVGAKLLFDVTGNTGSLAASGLFMHVGVSFVYYPHMHGNDFPFEIAFTDTILF